MTTEELFSACAEDAELHQLLTRHGLTDYLKTIEMGNISQSKGRPALAVAFFEAACSINPREPSVLLAKLKAQLQNSEEPSPADLENLTELDKDHGEFFRSLLASRVKPNRHDTIEILRRLGTATESFYTGAEPDWLYLRLASPIMQVAPQPPRRPGSIPRRLFMYWDKEPPQAIVENIAYHRALGSFEVENYDKSRTIEFLRSYYGSDCARMFGHLRHASEESDFFRWHAIYAYGGYYLDMDNQIISTAAFEEVAVTMREAIFFLSGSGPIESCFFGACRRANVLDECLRTLMYNCAHAPNLSMWLKTGPGVVTRSVVRSYHRALFQGDPMPDLTLVDEHLIAGVIREVAVDYRSDERDWRVFERQAAG